MEPDPIPHLDYLEAPFPCAIDIAILHCVIRFSRVDEAARAEICDAPIAPQQIDLLLRFAQRMAHASIVQHQLRLAEAGLVALVIVGHNASARAVWHLIAGLHKSISALTASPERVFRHVAALAAASAVFPLLEGFVCRDSDGRVV